MKWIEARVTLDHPDPELAVDLVAAAFFELDLQGVVIDDPGLSPEEDWAEDAVAAPRQHAVIGYFVGDRRAEWVAGQLAAKLAVLKDSLGLVSRASYRQVDDQNWAEAWKAFFWPHRVGERLVVKPTWRAFKARPGDLIIELDPGMAFGTGTHPTTALCLALIEGHLRPADSFLDIGTGSGILLVAAALLGAGRLHGIDKDAFAVRVAADNLALNGIDPGRWSVSCGHLLQAIRRPFDLVAANILAHVIIELLDDLPAVLSGDGRFICSGIIRSNACAVEARLDALGFEIIESRTRDEWSALVAKRKAPSA